MDLALVTRLAATLVASVIALAFTATAANAYTQFYEGWRGPAGEISTRGRHSWAYTQGAVVPADGYVVCSYMYNAHLGRVRGGSAGINCRINWAFINWGPTADAWYVSWATNATGSLTRYMTVYATT